MKIKKKNLSNETLKSKNKHNNKKRIFAFVLFVNDFSIWRKGWKYQRKMTECQCFTDVICGCLFMAVEFLYKLQQQKYDVLLFDFSVVIIIAVHWHARNSFSSFYCRTDLFRSSYACARNTNI